MPLHVPDSAQTLADGDIGGKSEQTDMEVRMWPDAARSQRPTTLHGANGPGVE